MADSDLADGNAMVDGVRKFAEEEGARVVIVSAQVESELVDLDGEDKQEFLESLGEAALSALLVLMAACWCWFHDKCFGVSLSLFFYLR